MHNYYIVSKEIESYISEQTEEEDEILLELDRETHLKHLYPRMLSGHIQGKLLKILVSLVSPKRILEIGTYTGYSAICMGSGLAEDGELHTIDYNKEFESISDKYFNKAGLRDKIHSYFGNALEVIPTLNKRFDMVFIDADKENYPKYLDLVKPIVCSGGVILADNVLWGGKVLDPEKADKNTRGLLEFNKKVKQDQDLEGIIISVRDGLFLIRKK